MEKGWVGQSTDPSFSILPYCIKGKYYGRKCDETVTYVFYNFIKGRFEKTVL